jgi:RimJ/RimL family protein N-acetyltransferase
MIRYRTFITAHLNRLKRKKTGDEYFSLPVVGKSNETWADLKPLTFDYVSLHPECVPLLTAWRNENAAGFASRFMATAARTRAWIEKQILQRIDRILFLIFLADGSCVGHIGLSAFDFSQRSCELDNVVRGVKNALPGLMSHAARAMIGFAFGTLQVKELYLRVLADNAHAVRFYQRLGFKETARLPLYKEIHDDEIRWEQRPNRGGLPDKYYLKMKYDENAAAVTAGESEVCS